ncbi:MAG TPA: ABC transporter substrate-binding protein, partial [Burkholderiales bacterium]|nr:ABC transporter substrate-binding protein [Burkholderiales bacterium]
MRPSISRAVTGALFGALLGLGLTAALSASAEEARTAFRVCQDPNNLPFSNTKGEGFENKLAELLAAKLGLPVEYYNFPQRMGFIRNTLAFKLPGEDYRCDVVMGVPADYDQAAPTRPYYRSAYALVVGPKLNDVRAPQDLPALAPERRTGL